MFYSHAVFWLYLGTLLPYALCLVLYGFRSPWRSTPVGRGLLALYAALVAVLAFAVVAQITVIPPSVRDVMRAALLGGVALAGWIQLSNIVRLQRERRDSAAPNCSTTEEIP